MNLPPAPKEIKGFFDDWRFLSNFWLIGVEWEGMRYPSSEHAFQASKFVEHEDRKLFQRGSPFEAKRLARQMQEKWRKDWHEVKDDVMLKIVRIKFSKGLYRDKLLATGDAYLEETNSWGDDYWGVCRGRGENKLGKILMRVRDELRGILVMEVQFDYSAKAKVLNKKHNLPDDAGMYVGRPSRWGNPFVVGEDVRTNEEARDAFRTWVMKQPELLLEIKRELKGKDLICWCAPKACHAEVLIEIANS